MVEDAAFLRRNTNYAHFLYNPPGQYDEAVLTNYTAAVTTGQRIKGVAMRVGRINYGNQTLELWDCGHPAAPPVTPAVAAPPPTPRGLGLILSISNQIAAIDRKEASVRAAHRAAQEHYKLKTVTGETAAQERAWYAQSMQYEQQYRAFNHQRAALKLREYEYRKLYKIPNAPPVKQPKR